MLRTFIATTIARAADILIDKMWLDSLSALVGEFFPLNQVQWWYILLYTCVLTLLLLLMKKMLEFCESLLDQMGANNNTQEKNEQLLADLKNSAPETYPH